MVCVYCKGSIIEDDYDGWGYTINELDESIDYHHTECIEVLLPL